MAEDQLVSFIIRSRQKGRSDEQIKSSLLSVGWKKERVESAFAQIARRPAGAEPEPEPQEQPRQAAPQISSPITSVPGDSMQPQPLRQPPWQGQQQPLQQQEAAAQMAKPASAQPEASPVSQQPAEHTEAPKKGPLSFLLGLAGKIRLPKKKAQAAQEQGLSSSPAQAPYGAGIQAQAALSQVQPAKRIVPPPLPGTAQASAQQAAAQPSLPAAAPAGTARSQLFAKATIVAILLIAAGAIYLAMSSKPSAPPSQPGVQPNQTQPNGTAALGGNASGAAGQLPANQSGGNASQPALPPPNQSAVTPPVPPPVQPQPQPPVIRATPPSQQPEPPPSSQPAAQPQAPSPEQQPQNQTYARIIAYQSSGPFSPQEFCSMEGGTFVRAHFREYYSGDCMSEKKIEGTANLTEFAATKCEIIPCCVAGPYKEYSTKYDYFECGYAKYP